MATIRLAYDSLYSAAATVLTASSEAVALPVDASKNPDRSYVWRSLTQTGVQTVDADLGSVKAVSSAFVANVRLLGSGALELYERGDGGSPGAATLVATLPTQDGSRRTAVSFFASASHRHWQLKWMNPGADNDFAELGLCHLGTYFEPTINVSVPIEIEEIDPSDVRTSLDRQRSTAQRTRYQAGRYTWEFLPDADRTSLSTLFETIGVRIPLFVTLDTTRTWTTWLAYLVSAFGLRFEEIEGRYGAGLEWEEAT